jgi:quinol monooxygenase YgiN
MTEVSTVAVITAKPEFAAEVEAALSTLAAATHAEPGCLLYSLQRGLQEPNVFVTVEKWDSMESLQAHLASPHITEALSTTGDLLTGPPQIIAAEMLTVGDPAKSTY